MSLVFLLFFYLLNLVVCFLSFSSYAAKQWTLMLEWLNTILPDLCLPTKASDEELRASLIDGTVLCKILNRLRPGSLDEVV